MKRLAFAVAGLALALCAVPARSTEDGYVNSEGYTWKSPYWWYDGTPYVRKQVAYTAYTTSYSYPSYSYGYGYSYPTYYQTPYTYYKYTYTAVPLPKASDPDFRSKLIDVYAAQRKYEAVNIKQRVDQEAFNESVRVLGLDSVFKYVGAVGSPYNGYSSANSYGQVSTTAYGHTVQQLTDIYGTANPDILPQAAARLTERAVEFAAQTGAQLNNATAAQVQGTIRAAEIRAKGEAAALALKAAAADPSFHLKTTKTYYGVTPAGQVESRQVQLTPQEYRVQACGQCHSGKNVMGKFDVTLWDKFTDAQLDNAWERVTTDDPDKLMPRDLKDPTKPGHKMSTEQAEYLFGKQPVRAEVQPPARPQN